MDRQQEPVTDFREPVAFNRERGWRWLRWPVLVGSLLVSASCSSVWVGTHEGVRFTIHQDRRWSRIENKNKEGPFTYDSPELTVTADDGRLVINSEDAGELNPGDHVEITDLGTVLVNGVRRGDAFTGQRALDERLSRRDELLKQAVLHEDEAKTAEVPAAVKEPIKRASATSETDEHTIQEKPAQAGPGQAALP